MKKLERNYVKPRQHWPKKGDNLPDYYYEQQSGAIGNALGINKFWEGEQVYFDLKEDKRCKYHKGFKGYIHIRL